MNYVKINTLSKEQKKLIKQWKKVCSKLTKENCTSELLKNLSIVLIGYIGYKDTVKLLKSFNKSDAKSNTTINAASEEIDPGKAIAINLGIDTVGRALLAVAIHMAKKGLWKLCPKLLMGVAVAKMGVQAVTVITKTVKHLHEVSKIRKEELSDSAKEALAEFEEKYKKELLDAFEKETADDQSDNGWKMGKIKRMNEFSYENIALFKKESEYNLRHECRMLKGKGESKEKIAEYRDTKQKEINEKYTEMVNKEYERLRRKRHLKYTKY